MPDVKKTIKGLTEALMVIEVSVPERYRGYSIYAIKDALALLKAQEPVEPVKANGSSGYWCRCGWYLGIRFSGISGSVKYCANCGRKVKWNDSD